MATKGTTTKKKETAKPAAKKTTKKQQTLVSFEDIQKRAFEIFVSNGGSTSAEENWAQAEKELAN